MLGCMLACGIRCSMGVSCSYMGSGKLMSSARAACRGGQGNRPRLGGGRVLALGWLGKLGGHPGHAIEAAASWHEWAPACSPDPWNAAP